MGLFAKKNKRAQRHIACISEMISETDGYSDAVICFPMMKINVKCEHGFTAVQLKFEGKKIHITATYEPVLSYYGKGIAFREFMKLNKEPGIERKENWIYEIDPDSQKMVFTEKYKMKYKPNSNNGRFETFFERVFHTVPANFDTIQRKTEMRGSIHAYSMNNAASTT